MLPYGNNLKVYASIVLIITGDCLWLIKSIVYSDVWFGRGGKRSLFLPKLCYVLGNVIIVRLVISTYIYPY